MTRLKNDENTGAVLSADKDNLEGILRQTLLDLDAAFCRHWRLGGPTVFEDLTDSPENQHVFLALLQNLKSKISEKSGQN